MFLSLSRRVRWGYILAFLLLLISYFLIFFAIQRLLKESNSVTHTYSVIHNLQQLKADVTDAETGVRGYLITRDVRFLKPYNNATRNIAGNIAALNNVLDDTSMADYKILIDLIDRRMDLLDEGLSSFQREGFVITPEMQAKRNNANDLMDSIRTYFQRMEFAEESRITVRKSTLSEFFSASKIITIVSLIIAMIAIFFSWLTYHNENKAKVVADKKAEQYREELEQNILELEHANQELQELKSIEKFAATGRIARTIAHEVRNPLTNISLAAEQIQEITGDNSDSNALLQMVSRNANRINQLVSDLLNATRFVQLDFSRINLNDLLEQTLELAKDRIELKNIRVEKNYTQDKCEVMVDVEKMKFAILNIIVNAIEAMEKNTGVLTLRSKAQGETAIIEVRDNGTGMDEEAMQRLFEPYFTAKPNGNGLGLTNTQNIILNHQGKIKAYSKLGGGSSFLITLNLAKN
jgi:signal transduction histidine kinase